MLLTIHNSFLKVDISSLGAELFSIQDRNNTEYLWQGDPAYWGNRAPNLFPYIGRMIDKKYEYQGQTYEMGIHGFAASMEFDVLNHTADEITFRIEDNAQTTKQYPWHFSYEVNYRLVERRLYITYRVENRDSKPMLYALGGHPGINVPLKGTERFEDYRLRFTEPSTPEQILFSAACFVKPERKAYILDKDNSIPLRHDLFDNDAIVLKNSGHRVILENIHGKNAIEVDYPQMKYIGFWQADHTDAPYVCIEPWSSLPSAEGEKTVLEHQDDLLKLAPGQIDENTWSIMVK